MKSMSHKSTMKKGASARNVGSDVSSAGSGNRGSDVAKKGSGQKGSGVK